MAIIDKDKMIYGLDGDLDLGDYKIEFSKKEKSDIRVVFMGTPSFAVPILEGLIENYHVVMVVCQPDRKKDRKGNMIIPDTKRVALEKGIAVFQPLHIIEDYKRILECNPDIIITCAYGQMIPKEVIDFPKYGCINVHGSLLPELRGGAPIHWAIIRGYHETGITIMKMSQKMDAGDIISQAKLEIGKEEILDSLYERMSYLGKELLLVTLPKIVKRMVQYFPQDEEKVTFGYNVSREDARIDFHKNGQDIFNLVRGLNSSPAAYCTLNGKRMKVYQVELVEIREKRNYQIGEIVRLDSDGIIVQCGDGGIKLLEIGIEGKKRCMVKDYLNGVQKEMLIGKVLV